VPALRRRDDPGPDPLRTPTEDDRPRLRFLMTGDLGLTGGPLDVLTPTCQESGLSLSCERLSVRSTLAPGVSLIGTYPARSPDSPDSAHPNVGEFGL
jgi:hypothetical protein